jgi:hypothetical protein
MKLARRSAEMRDHAASKVEAVSAHVWFPYHHKRRKAQSMTCACRERR